MIFFEVKLGVGGRFVGFVIIFVELGLRGDVGGVSDVGLE